MVIRKRRIRRRRRGYRCQIPSQSTPAGTLLLRNYYYRCRVSNRGVVLPTMDSSANNDTNEIDLSSSSDEESSCASSGGNEDDSTRSTPCNKRIKREGTTNDVSVTNRRLDGVTATSELDVTKPHFLTLGTGCASPSPLRGSTGYALLLPTKTMDAVLL